MSLYQGFDCRTRQSMAGLVAANAFLRGFRAFLMDYSKNAIDKVLINEPAVSHYQLFTKRSHQKNQLDPFAARESEEWGRISGISPMPLSVAAITIELPYFILSPSLWIYPLRRLELTGLYRLASMILQLRMISLTLRFEKTMFSDRSSLKNTALITRKTDPMRRSDLLTQINPLTRRL